MMKVTFYKVYWTTKVKKHEELMIGDNYKRTANNLIFIASEHIVQKSIFNKLMDDLEKNNGTDNNLIKTINNFFNNIF